MLSSTYDGYSGMNIEHTEHSRSRAQQRGLRKGDIETIIERGTPVDHESVMLLGRDVDREVRRLKREIRKLERLRGFCIVTASDNKIVTVYRPRKNIEKSILRGERYPKSNARHTNA